MSIHELMLDGWEHTSTWGSDGGLYYAQLTRNSVPNTDSPEMWISPPSHIIRSATELRHAIADATGEPIATIDEAMRRGLAVSRGEWVAPVVSTVESGASLPPAAPGRADARSTDR